MEFNNDSVGGRRISSNSRPDKAIEFVRGAGATLWDARGIKYVDLSSQTMNLLLGQCHDEVAQAIHRQLTTLTFIDQQFQHALYQQAMDALSKMLPSALSVFNFRMNDGSSAVECAVKMARRLRRRGKVLTFDGIYVGQNTQCLHLRGWGQRRSEVLFGSTEDVVFAPLPRPDFAVPLVTASHENGEAACDLIRQLHADLACVLIDPVMISSGVTMGRDMPGLVHAVIAEAHRHSVPVVLDECQTFGWVPGGTLSRHFGFDADIVVLGKGIGGGMPLAVCALKPELDGLEWGDADYTNGGTLAAMAGLVSTCAVLARPETCRHVAAVTEDIAAFCHRLEHRYGGQVATRGIGLIRAVQLCGRTLHASMLAAARVSAACLASGVILRKHMDCLTLKPPITIGLSELGEAMNTLEKCIGTELERAK